MISSGRCQFCHRTADDVEKLIAGDSAFICNACVSACCALLRPEPGEMTLNDPLPERQLFQRLAKHFAPLRPDSLIATSRTYPLRQQADLQMALDNLFGERRIPDNFVGVHQQYRHEALGFSKLLEQSRNVIGSLAREGGLTPHCGLAPGTISRAIRRGDAPVQGTARKKPSASARL